MIGKKLTVPVSNPKDDYGRIEGIDVMKIGYARVSTNDQDTQLQIDALNYVGCERIYEEKQSRPNKIGLNYSNV